jgi:hypothetical protein
LKGSDNLLLHPYDLMYCFTCCVIEQNDEDVIIAAMAVMILSKRFHGDFVVGQHLNWEQHVNMLHQEGMFKKMYQVSFSCFNRLLDMLKSWLKVDEKQSHNASKGIQPITAEMILHYTLHYLSGSSVHDIRVTAGISYITFYRLVHHGFDAINACSCLSLMFLITLQDLTVSANE